MKINLEMYGLPAGVTQIRQMELNLAEGSDLGALVGRLREVVPGLSGSVIASQEDRLLDTYAFIINGQFQTADSLAKLKAGDRVVLVLLATGG